MRTIIRVISINIAVLLFGIISCEVFFGNWIFGPDYRALNIPRNTERVFDVENLYSSGGKIKYTRDENGFRGPYDNVSLIDVLTLGGSTTNQLYVDDDKTWQSEMRRLFADQGNPISIVNAGVDGQSSRGHNVVFDRWFSQIENLNARFVIVYAAINDIALRGAVKYDDMHSPDPTRRFAAWLKNKSAIYELYKIFKGMYLARNAAVIHGSGVVAYAKWSRWMRRDETQEAPPEYTEQLLSFETRLRRLAERIRAFGAEPIFVTQPSAEYRLDGEWILLPAVKDMPSVAPQVIVLHLFNDIVMQTCLDVKAVCVDVAGNVEFRDGDFYDRIHNTDRGAKKIGTYLFKALKERL
ncbi:GDSL-type esterase/lipase family protein [Rhodospirillales bacterium]|nr:GDSL-type esterase/lipase family protein [Rhodospirillales bacterium]